ncbi:MAG: TetR/AcrR family transcriptional regulator [Coriobacteriales bacterium]|jgi:AcrR family transcriptional regulator|nr:TetR/AcrR family transcriptional regulator [Coriobacteriales bacterium]
MTDKTQKAQPTKATMSAPAPRPEAAAAESTTRPRSASNGRREEIIAVACELYETRGLSRTSVKDITDRVGVTRSLFYRYFQDKDELTSRVLDVYVDEFIEGLHYWNAQREFGNVEKALKDVLHFFRTAILSGDSFRRSLASYENTALYLRFTNRVADRIARYIVDSTVKEYALYHKVEIDHVYETFYMLICGLIALIRAYPDISDEVLKDIAAQTLHLDLGGTLPVRSALERHAFKA